VPLTPDTVLRTDDAAGDSFLTFLTGAGSRAQGVAVVNLNGDPMGVSGTPFFVSVSNNVTLDDATPINVNIASSSLVTTHSIYSSAAAQASHQISGVTATLIELRVISDPAVTLDRYVMIFDSIASIASLEGTAPIWRAYLPAGAAIGESWGDVGLEFTTGITVAISSTIGNLTLTGAEAYFHSVSYV